MLFQRFQPILLLVWLISFRIPCLCGCVHACVRAWISLGLSTNKNIIISRFGRAYFGWPNFSILPPPSSPGSKIGDNARFFAPSHTPTQSLGRDEDKTVENCGRMARHLHFDYAKICGGGKFQTVDVHKTLTTLAYDNKTIIFFVVISGTSNRRCCELMLG